MDYWLAFLLIAIVIWALVKDRGRLAFVLFLTIVILAVGSKRYYPDSPAGHRPHFPSGR